MAFMKAIGGTLLLFFIGSMFVSLFHMSSMDMHAGMTNCPFMAHEEVICPMNLIDHIGAWKSVFLSIAPALTLLFAITGVAVLIGTVAPNLLRRIIYSPPPLARCIREKIYTFTYRPLQEMYSNGILNPKLF